MKRFCAYFLTFVLLFSFCGCSDANPVSDFEYHADGDYTVIDKYIGDSLTVVIPEEIDDKPVISIGSEAFKSSAITSVTIPDSVEIIRTEAFAECDALTDVKFGNSVTYLGARSFYSCDALEMLELPRNLITTGEYAVAECKSLKELTVPKTLKRCYDSVFATNESLVTINFEDGLEVIPSTIFSQCTALETLKIPASVKSIQFSAFYNCNSLKDVYFAGDEVEISSDAFKRRNREEINMHYNAKEKVPTVTLERTAPNTFDSETRVNPAAHFQCGLGDKGLITEYISSDETVVIPEIIDGHPVEKIGSAAFFGMDIKTVTFPKTIRKFIGPDTFGFCKSLESVYFKGDAPELGQSYVFGTKDKDFVVYYEAGAAGWDDTPLREWYTLVEK